MKNNLEQILSNSVSIYKREKPTEYILSLSILDTYKANNINEFVNYNVNLLNSYIEDLITAKDKLLTLKKNKVKIFRYKDLKFKYLENDALWHCKVNEFDVYLSQEIDCCTDNCDGVCCCSTSGWVCKLVLSNLMLIKSPKKLKKSKALDFVFKEMQKWSHRTSPRVKRVL